MKLNKTNKKVFRAMWLSVMILAVLTITSCSSDELFDFYEIPNEDYNNILNCEKYSEYLDWDFTGNLVDASDQVDGNSFPIKRVQSNLNISSIYK